MQEALLELIVERLGDCRHWVNGKRLEPGRRLLVKKLSFGSKAQDWTLT